MFSNENAYNDQVNAAAVQYGVEPALIKAVIGHESGFNAKAFRAEPGGLIGSFGLMQLLPSTAKAFGADTSDPNILYDPWTNVLAGTAYLKSCLQRTGSMTAALSMYNGGYRPALGFGAPVVVPTTVTLSKDANGKPLTTFTAQPGQFGNQAYVDSVVSLYNYFTQKAAVGDAQAPSINVQGTGGQANTVWLAGLVVVGIISALVLKYK